MPTGQLALSYSLGWSRAGRVAGSRALHCLLALLASTPGAWAGQEQVNEGVAPESAQQASTPLERAFEKVPGGLQLNAVTDWARKQLQDTPAFIRDTQLTLKPRTYFFYQDKTTQTPTDPSECISGEAQCTASTHAIEEAWAIGGSLEYKSGWLYDHFRVGAEYFGSWPLYAGPNAGDTLLLTPSGGSYTVLGQAYAQLKFWDQVLTAGDSEYGTPYVNRQFNRMTPNTFEGVSLKGSFTGLRGKDFDYLVGYLSKIKQRNSTEFIPMSQVLGPADNYYGTYIAQFLFTAWGASVGLSEYYTPQNLNIVYAEAAWTPKVSGNYGLKLSVQYTMERAVGSASLTDLLQSVPLAGNAGARATFSYERSVLSLAYSLTGSQGAIVSPWGSNPSYTDGSIRNGNRPHEQAALLNYSYDFQKLGVPGLSATAIYSYGWNAKDPTTSQPLSNQWELDLVADYRLPEGTFKGLWFRLQRNQLQNTGDTNATTQWRAIVYWETPLI
jgi:hypothetical protein